MNELPRVGEANSGLFRRVKVVAFPPLAEDRRDPRIKDAIRNEGAGILNWALDGLDRLKRRGRFEIPASVADATTDFKATNDIPEMFIDEMCVQGPGYRTQAKALYDAYKLWCVDNGHKPQSSTSLAEDWKRLGLDRCDVNGRRFWRGVGLTDQREGAS
jgi:putative DNA primase/helicase